MVLNYLGANWRNCLLCLLLVFLIISRAEAVKFNGNSFPWDAYFTLKSEGNIYVMFFPTPYQFRQTGEIHARVQGNTGLSNYVVDISSGFAINPANPFTNITPEHQDYGKQHQPLFLLVTIGLALLYMQRPELKNEVNIGQNQPDHTVDIEKLFAKQMQLTVVSPTLMVLSIPPNAGATRQGEATELHANGTRIEITISPETEHSQVQFVLHFMNASSEWQTLIFTMPITVETPLLTAGFLSGAWFEKAEDEEKESSTVGDPVVKEETPRRNDGDDDEDETGAGAGTGCASCFTSICKYVCKSGSSTQGQQADDKGSQKSSDSGNQDKTLTLSDLIVGERLTSQFRKVLQSGVKPWAMEPAAQSAW